MDWLPVAHAQYRSATGQVVDGTSRQGLPGVTVLVPGTTNHISDLNPDDIENIEVLKGSSAAFAGADLEAVQVKYRKVERIKIELWASIRSQGIVACKKVADTK